jgi:hypothetical protein
MREKILLGKLQLVKAFNTENPIAKKCNQLYFEILFSHEKYSIKNNWLNEINRKK